MSARQWSKMEMDGISNCATQLHTPRYEEYDHGEVLWVIKHLLVAACSRPRLALRSAYASSASVDPSHAFFTRGVRETAPAWCVALVQETSRQRGERGQRQPQDHRRSTMLPLFVCSLRESLKLQAGHDDRTGQGRGNDHCREKQAMGPDKGWRRDLSPFE